MKGDVMSMETKTLYYAHTDKKAYQGGPVSTGSASAAGDLGVIPGSGRSPGEGKANHSSILARRIPWTV